ncbi:hypothetical protein NVIE_019290 [Nitrososphaera viennensis EN76]|uniref:Uncharacterized protein n=2 Tax=Nitrososphaera viennensis TaxID=1034015 RepID=A0A060HL14_9ARCH|nr:hypothetical protein NVIE_019290 [Nitrososphaera viennensis EN76]
MLGDLLFEQKGKTTGKRVLSAEGPMMEISFESQGKYKDIAVDEVGTFTAVPKPGGAMIGKGNGVIMSRDGEVASWAGSGIGKSGQGGRMSWRGAVFYQTTSQGKLAPLNNAVLVFEYDVDAEGNSTEKAWEWK